jgi:isocitrate dehydrogenase
MAAFENGKRPPEGKRIVVQDNKLLIPDNPVLSYIEGDGVGPEIGTVTRDVIDASVAKAYGGTKKIFWLQLYAGEASQTRFGSPLPQETIDAHPWEGGTGVSM